MMSHRNQDTLAKEKLNGLDKLTRGVNLMAKLFGAANNVLPPPTLGGREYVSDDRMWRDLWHAWSGDHYMQKEILLEGLMTKGKNILSLFPVMEFDEAHRKFQWRHRGETVVFDTWMFGTGPLEQKGKRTPGLLNKTSRHRQTQTFEHFGNNFIVPLDWPSSKEHRSKYVAYLDQVEQNVKQTWQLQIVNTLMIRSKRHRRELLNQSPIPYNDIGPRLQQYWDVIGALQKNGQGFAGIENNVVQKGLCRNVSFDAVLTTSGTAHFLYVQRHYSHGEYGNNVYLENRQQDVDTEGKAMTHLHGLQVFESRTFKLASNPYPVDPMVDKIYLSQFYTMLPGVPEVETSTDYCTRSRHISIVDADIFQSREITLRDAFRHCGLFDSSTPPTYRPYHAGGSHGGSTHNCTFNGRSPGNGRRVSSQLYANSNQSGQTQNNQIIADGAHSAFSEDVYRRCFPGRSLQTDSATDMFDSIGILPGVMRMFSSNVGGSAHIGHDGNMRVESPETLGNMRFEALKYHVHTVLNVPDTTSQFESRNADKTKYIATFNSNFDAACCVEVRDNRQQYASDSEGTYNNKIIDCTLYRDDRGSTSDSRQNIKNIKAFPIIVNSNEAPFHAKPCLLTIDNCEYPFLCLPCEPITEDHSEACFLGSKIVNISDDKFTVEQIMKVYSKTDTGEATSSASTSLGYQENGKFRDWVKNFLNTHIPRIEANSPILRKFDVNLAKFIFGHTFLCQNSKIEDTMKFKRDVCQYKNDMRMKTIELYTVNADSKLSSVPTLLRVKHMLCQLKANDPRTWEFFLDNNIPFPVGFLLFRMHVKVEVGSMLFMKRGEKTAVMCVKDVGVTFERDVNDFSMSVGVRLSSNIFIQNMSNIELVPHIFIKRYISGGGVRFYDAGSSKVVSAYKNRGNVEADIFSVMVPYRQQLRKPFLDISGAFSSLNQQGKSKESFYDTAPAYAKLWDWKSNPHMLDIDRTQGRTKHVLSACAQSSQYGYNYHSRRCDLLQSGVCAMGPQANPHNWRIALNGDSVAYTGTGYENSRPSPVQMSTYHP